MEHFSIPFINDLYTEMPLSFIEESINKKNIKWENIDNLNWLQFSYKPIVNFKIICLNNGVFLHFNVTENHVLGRYTTDNNPMYKDSCVEFFIDPLCDGNYYNFEFNCLGSLLLGFGKNRENRTKPLPAIYNSIARSSSLGNNPVNLNEQKSWELNIVIPNSALFMHNIKTFKHTQVKLNVYKCGDETNTPHYLTWAPIKTERPDFHRPEFFKTVLIK